MIRGVEEYETGIMTEWNERVEVWKRGRGDKLKTGGMEEWTKRERKRVGVEELKSTEMGKNG
jgi:hypothetical protein